MTTSATARTVTLDMTDVQNLLTEILETLEGIHGKEVMVDYDRGRSRANNPDNAAISRDLLRVADLATLAAGELSVAYWRFKGFEDPRGEIVPR